MKCEFNTLVNSIGINVNSIGINSIPPLINFLGVSFLYILCLHNTFAFFCVCTLFLPLIYIRLKMLKKC